MYWTFTIAWFLFGLVFFWNILSSKWNRIDPLYRRMFQTLMILNPIPGHEGYLDLKFSVLRHSVVFIVSAALIYWFHDARFLLNTVLTLNLLYTFSVFSRYKMRRKHLDYVKNELGEEHTAEIIQIPIKDSKVVAIHAVICVVMLYVLYGIRPY